MDHNAAKSPPPTDSPAASKAEAIKQLTENAGEGSLFQQLASNPFFTAVCFERLV